MGGEIKVVKKDGQGTLMQLYLVLNTPADGTEQYCQANFAKHSIVVSKVVYFKFQLLVLQSRNLTKF